MPSHMHRINPLHDNHTVTQHMPMVIWLRQDTTVVRVDKSLSHCVFKCLVHIGIHSVTTSVKTHKVSISLRHKQSLAFRYADCMASRAGHTASSSHWTSASTRWRLPSRRAREDRYVRIHCNSWGVMLLPASRSMGQRGEPRIAHKLQGGRRP